MDCFIVFNHITLLVKGFITLGTHVLLSRLIGMLLLAKFVLLCGFTFIEPQLWLNLRLWVQYDMICTDKM